MYFRYHSKYKCGTNVSLHLPHISLSAYVDQTQVSGFTSYTSKRQSNPGAALYARACSCNVMSAMSDSKGFQREKKPRAEDTQRGEAGICCEQEQIWPSGQTKQTVQALTA